MKFIVGVLIALLIGFEGPTLRRWTLARRGWINHGVVVADDEESAERRFFDAWIAREARPVPAAGRRYAVSLGGRSAGRHRPVSRAAVAAAIAEASMSVRP